MYRKNEVELVYPDLNTHSWFTMYMRGCIFFSLMNAGIKGSEFTKFFNKNEGFSFVSNRSLPENHFRTIRGITHEYKAILAWLSVSKNNVMGDGGKLSKIRALVYDMLNKSTVDEAYDIAQKIKKAYNDDENYFAYIGKKDDPGHKELAQGEWKIPGIQVKSIKNIRQSSWQKYLNMIPYSSVVCFEDHWVQYLGRSGNAVGFCDPMKHDCYVKIEFEKFVSNCYAVIEKGGTLMFDESCYLSNGELDFDKLEKMGLIVDDDPFENYTYEIDEDSEYKRDEKVNGPLCGMYWDDVWNKRKEDRYFYGYVINYLYMHGAFNLIKEIYTDYGWSEGSFKYLEGMKSGYKKKYWPKAGNISDISIFGTEPETVSRCYPDQKILEYDEYLLRNLRHGLIRYDGPIKDVARYNLSQKNPGLLARLDSLLEQNKYQELKDLCIKEQVHPVFLVQAEKEEEMYLYEVNYERENRIDFSKPSVNEDFSGWRKEELKRIKELEQQVGINRKD